MRDVFGFSILIILPSFPWLLDTGPLAGIIDSAEIVYPAFGFINGLQPDAPPTQPTEAPNCSPPNPPPPLDA